MAILGKLSILFTGLLILAGCATTVLRDEPDHATTSLVVGRIELLASNFRSYRSANINGTQSLGVEIHLIEETHNNRFILQSSGSDGLFYSTKLKPGQYEIEKLRFKKNSSKCGAVSIWFRPTENNGFVIQPGKVNNLGCLSWSARNFINKPKTPHGGIPTDVKYVFYVDELGIFRYEDEDRDYFPLSIFTANAEYQVARKLFEDNFSESGWLDFEWVNVPIE